MAVYHLGVRMICRSKGHSAVKAAAQRARAKLYDFQARRTFNYSRYTAPVYETVLVPDGAPNWAADRERLWNEVERRERRKDSALARSVDVSLPIELALEGQIALVSDFAREGFTALGMAADLTLHHDRPGNPYAHLLLTTRRFVGDVFGEKEREWNGRDQLIRWRSLWASCANRHLFAAGSDARIDHRSNAARRLTRIPQIKVGISAERLKSPSAPAYAKARAALNEIIDAQNRCVGMVTVLSREADDVRPGSTAAPMP